MTLKDILSERKIEIEPEEDLEPTEYAKPSEQIDFSADIMGISITEKEPVAENPMKQNEIEAIKSVIGSMTNYEKEIAVHSIPTEILQNEISRRMNRDREALKGIRNILGALDEY